MLFRLPDSSLHGWREFFHEIIIVGHRRAALALGGRSCSKRSVRAAKSPASARRSIMSSAVTSQSTKHHQRVRPCVNSPYSRTRALPSPTPAPGATIPLARPIGRPFMQTCSIYRALDNKAAR